MTIIYIKSIDTVFQIEKKSINGWHSQMLKGHKELL